MLYARLKFLIRNTTAKVNFIKIGINVPSRVVFVNGILNCIACGIGFIILFRSWIRNFIGIWIQYICVNFRFTRNIIFQIFTRKSNLLLFNCFYFYVICL